MAVPRDITDFVNLTFVYVMLPIANDIHKQAFGTIALHFTFDSP